MSYTTNLWGFTLALRDQFPTAGALRFRKVNKPSRTVWQLVGTHPKAGKVARQLDAATEAEVLSAGARLMNELDLGLKKGTVLTGTNRGVFQAASQRVEALNLRTATTDTRIRRIREVVDLLEERGLKATEISLKAAVEELAPTNDRRRRAICTAARDVAKAAKVELDLTGLQYQEQAPRKLEALDDATLFRRLDKHLPKIDNPGAVWVFRMVAVTGIRGNGCLSLDYSHLTDFECINPEMSDRWRYWDAKRNRPAFASQTIREWWYHWGLNLPPEDLKPYWMPCDQRPTDEQLVNANKLLSAFTGLLRRKVHPEASQSIGFRALRHAATGRLLRAGVPILDVAEITSSSITEIERTYSDLYRHTSASRAAELL